DEKTQQVKGAIELPGLLSFLADNSVKTKVQGLNDFPKSLHPPMIVHYFFDLMVTMGILCFVISGVYVLTLMFKKLRKFSTHKWMLYGILLTGPASMLAIEFGWFLTEMGRQPWIVRSYMRVAEAATQAGGITFVTILFGILYIILMYTCAYVLIRMFKNKPAYEDVNRLAKKQGGEIEK
ncbi:TPA: cytochrome ubiquinol oxidase subunit I, partial [Staphylococcus aureus]|nr:cytochrome ubiquinol oxidase subunit I [Staphylococcus aureus]